MLDAQDARSKTQEGLVMYPLKFQPVFQKRIWGGQRLRTILGKALPVELQRDAVGESWELADLPPGTVKADSAGGAADGSMSSVITNGPLAGKTLHEVLGNSEFRIQNSELTYFPLLVKFLDAAQDLSVQVHPDEAYVKTHPDAALKSECWYILHAEPGAKIYKGLKPGVTKEQFRAALENGQVEPLLNAIKVRPGDCHYLKSGTVHALGAGILAAEVQTPSDTTFRVFDWNRLGPDGKPRKLHIEEALSCIHFGPEESAAAGGQKSHVASLFTTVTRLVTCDYFTLERVRMSQDMEQDIPYSEPVVWIVLEGQGVINVEGHPPTAFVRGDTMLLPASMKQAKIKTVTDCAWLEARLPGGVAEPN